MFLGGQDYANNVAVDLALTGGQNVMYNIKYQITV